MADKPTTAAGYTSEHVARVRSTCLYVATKLGDLMDDLVVGTGLQDVAASLAPLLEDPAAAEAISILRRDFSAHNGLGPRRAAHFLCGGPDDAAQADVVGFVTSLLRALGRA